MNKQNKWKHSGNRPKEKRKEKERRTLRRMKRESIEKEHKKEGGHGEGEKSVKENELGECRGGIQGRKDKGAVTSKTTTITTALSPITNKKKYQ